LQVVQQQHLRMGELLQVVARLADAAVAGGGARVDPVQRRALTVGALQRTAERGQVIAQRASDGCQVLGLRFTGDKLVGTRFASLRDLLGDAFIAVELPSNSPKDHSVLTEQRDEASVTTVIEFLQSKLQ
jgi:hypothetical protein